MIIIITNATNINEKYVFMMFRLQLHQHRGCVGRFASPELFLYYDRQMLKALYSTTKIFSCTLRIDNMNVRFKLS